MRSHDVMSSPVITVTPDTAVKYAANLLTSHGFTALPVVDNDDRPIGIITEVDLVRGRFPRDARYRQEDDAVLEPGMTVADVMTTPAICMSQTSDIVDVITVMLDDKIRSVPIVDGSRVVGIVTRRDLVQIIGRDDDAITSDVRHRLANYAGPDRWTVDVHDGVVVLGDEFDDVAERHVAIVLAEAVPGVIAAHCGPTPHQGAPS